MKQLWMPPAIRARLQNKPFSENTTGMSGARVLIFEDLVLKIQKDAPWAEREVTMLRWLEGKLPVPDVVEYEKHDGMSYLLMTRARGRMSCDDIFFRQPELLIDRLAEAMQMLWRVDITACPVLRDQNTELAEALNRVRSGLVHMDQVDTYGMDDFQNPEEILCWLANNKPTFEPVLSHGDFCLPNIFLTEHGISGFIDLGDSGIGDRWKDIALCYRSLKHNVDGTHGVTRPGVNADRLFDVLGIAPDVDKLRWYLLLDEFF